MKKKTIINSLVMILVISLSLFFVKGSDNLDDSILESNTNNYIIGKDSSVFSSENGNVKKVDSAPINLNNTEVTTFIISNKDGKFDLSKKDGDSIYSNVELSPTFISKIKTLLDNENGVMNDDIMGDCIIQLGDGTNPLETSGSSYHCLSINGLNNNTLITGKINGYISVLDAKTITLEEFEINNKENKVSLYVDANSTYTVDTYIINSTINVLNNDENPISGVIINGDLFVDGSVIKNENTLANYNGSVFIDVKGKITVKQSNAEKETIISAYSLNSSTNPDISGAIIYAKYGYGTEDELYDCIEINGGTIENRASSSRACAIMMAGTNSTAYRRMIINGGNIIGSICDNAKEANAVLNNEIVIEGGTIDGSVIIRDILDKVHTTKLIINDGTINGSIFAFNINGQSYAANDKCELIINGGTINYNDNMLNPFVADSNYITDQHRNFSSIKIGGDAEINYEDKFLYAKNYELSGTPTINAIFVVDVAESIKVLDGYNPNGLIKIQKQEDFACSKGTIIVLGGGNEIVEDNFANYDNSFERIDSVDGNIVVAEAKRNISYKAYTYNSVELKYEELDSFSLNEGYSFQNEVLSGESFYIPGENGFNHTIEYNGNACKAVLAGIEFKKENGNYTISDFTVEGNIQDGYTITTDEQLTNDITINLSFIILANSNKIIEKSDEEGKYTLYEIYFNHYKSFDINDEEYISKANDTTGTDGRLLHPINGGKNVSMSEINGILSTITDVEPSLYLGCKNATNYTSEFVYEETILISNSWKIYGNAKYIGSGSAIEINQEDDEKTVYLYGLIKSLGIGITLNGGKLNICFNTIFSSGAIDSQEQSIITGSNSTTELFVDDTDNIVISSKNNYALELNGKLFTTSQHDLYKYLSLYSSTNSRIFLKDGYIRYDGTDIFLGQIFVDDSLAGKKIMELNENAYSTGLIFCYENIDGKDFINKNGEDELYIYYGYKLNYFILRVNISSSYAQGLEITDEVFCDKAYKGREISGWYTTSDFQEDTEFNGNTNEWMNKKTLYAKLAPIDYTVNHYFENLYETSTLVIDTLQGVPGDYTNAIAYEREGFTNEDFEQSQILMINSTSVTIVYKRLIYKITFNALQGKFSDDLSTKDESGKYESVIDVVENPKLSGKTFDGWYFSNDEGETLGEKLSNDAIYPAKNITVYAKWVDREVSFVDLADSQKVIYRLYEQLSPDLKITITYDNGEIEDESVESSMVSDFSTDEFKENVIAIITYGEKTLDYSYSVTKRALPEITVKPNIDNVIYSPNITLKDVEILSDDAESSVSGIYTWTNKETALSAKRQTCKITFIPDDIEHYENIFFDVDVVVAKASYVLPSISFDSEVFEYDGAKHKIEIKCSGELPSGVSVEYTNNDNIDAGVYEVTAVLKSTDTNYNEVNTTFKAKYAIIARALCKSEDVDKDFLKYYIVGEKLPEPTKEGYIFKGWYTNPDFTGEKVTIIDKLERNIELYAKFEKNNTGLIIAITISSIAVIAGVSLASYWFIIRKKKTI